MPVGVIDILEVVDVNKDEAERLMRAGRTTHFVCDGFVHFAAVRKSRQLVGLRNQFQFLVGLFQILGTFLDFLFQDFSMGIQFFNLALDGVVHGIERVAQLTQFVCAVAHVDFVDIEVPFTNLADVPGHAVQRKSKRIEHPCGDKEDYQN